MSIMTNHFRALIYASFIGLLIVAIFLGFLSSLTNPVPWLLIVALLLTPYIHDRLTKDQELKWTDDYSVGVESLDNEHRKILLLLNQFKTAYDYAMSEEYEQKALAELLEYTRYHFTAEEALMKKSNYPGLAEHQKEHQQMIDEINKIELRYEQVGHEAFEEVSSYLSNWLIHHITGSDRKYTAHLNNSGVS